MRFRTTVISLSLLCFALDGQRPVKRPDQRACPRSDEAFNLFDARVSDIDYFYRSRLPGEPLEGVEDIHLHPALPRSVRVGIQLSF